MMILAALEFSQPLMLIGLVSAAIPVLLHLQHRRRLDKHRFPTLRFLHQATQETSFRHHLIRWLLLLLRMALFGLLTMAMAAPWVRGSSPPMALSLILTILGGLALAAWGGVSLRQQPTPAADGEPTPKPISRRNGWISLATGLVLTLLGLALLLRPGSATAAPGSGRDIACVLILDNSFSMLAPGQETRLAWATRQAKELLSQTLRPAEHAVLLSNPGGRPQPQSLGQQIPQLTDLQARGKALDPSLLFNQAREMLTHSSRPHRVVVYISDLAGRANLPQALFETAKAAGIQLYALPASTSTLPELTLKNLTLVSGSPVVGSQIDLEVTLLNLSGLAGSQELQVLLDDQVLEEATVKVELRAGNDPIRTRFPLRLSTAGWHRLSVQWNHSPAWYHRRDLVLQVADRRHVRVVGPEARMAPRSTAHFVRSALDPFGRTPGSPWSLQVEYSSVEELTAQIRSEPDEGLFLCDLPQISTTLARRLKRHVQQGGQLVWVLGSSVNPINYQAASDAGLLPGRLTAPRQRPMGWRVNRIDPTSDPLGSEPYEAARQWVVSNYWELGQKVTATWTLSDDQPLLVRQTLGSGQIWTLLTTPAADWSNLGSSVLWVPTLARMALTSSSSLQGQWQFQAGDPLTLPQMQDELQTLEVTLPGEKAPQQIAWDPTHRVWKMPPLDQTGLYGWKAGGRQGLWVVNPPSEEADLRAGEPGIDPAFLAENAQDLPAKLMGSGRGSALTPMLLAMILMLTLGEAFLSDWRQNA